MGRWCALFSQRVCQVKKKEKTENKKNKNFCLHNFHRHPPKGHRNMSHRLSLVSIANPPKKPPRHLPQRLPSPPPPSPELTSADLPARRTRGGGGVKRVTAGGGTLRKIIFEQSRTVKTIEDPVRPFHFSRVSFRVHPPLHPRRLITEIPTFPIVNSPPTCIKT